MKKYLKEIGIVLLLIGLVSLLLGLYYAIRVDMQSASLIFFFSIIINSIAVQLIKRGKGGD